MEVAAEIVDPKLNTGFRTSYRPRVDLTSPVHKLLYAVLLDAVRRYQGRPSIPSPSAIHPLAARHWRYRTEQADEAETWIFVSGETDYICSFLYICDQLGIHPGLVREAVRSGQFDASYELIPSRTRTVPLRTRRARRQRILLEED
jgi:hypothetical protein